MITPLNPPRDFGSPFHSQGTLVTDIEKLVVVAGQVGARANGTIGKGIAEQTTIAMENVRAVLTEAGLDLTAVIKLTFYLTDATHIPEFRDHAAPYLHEDPTQRPAATLLLLPQLANPDLLIQIEAIAATSATRTQFRPRDAHPAPIRLT